MKAEKKSTDHRFHYPVLEPPAVSTGILSLVQTSEQLYNQWKRGQLVAGADVVARNEGLQPDFVSCLMQAVGDESYTRHGYRRSMRVPTKWRKLTDNPWLVPVYFFAPAFLLSVVLGLIPGGAFDLFGALFILAALIIHVVVCYQRSSLDYVLRMSLAFMGVLTGCFVLASLGGMMNLQSSSPGVGQAVLALIGGLLLSMIAAGFFVAASATGGIIKMQIEERQRAALSRQQLLERLFDIRDRLTAAESDAPLPRRVGWLQAQAVRFGLPIAITAALTASILDKIPRDSVGESWWGIAVASTLVISAFFLKLVTPLLLGFFVRQWRPVLLMWVTSGLVVAAVDHLPLGKEASTLANHLAGNVIQIMLYGIGVLVGLVSENRLEKERLEQNDRAALLAEQAELEAMLRPVKRRVCVLVVDAAGSSRMKANSDPFVAEWSFREYQNWILRVCGRHLGTVHATAGDGAVVGFSDCAHAVMAAMELQATLPVFNDRVNRIPSPFLLRIGLHAGDIEGELDKVQFTEVIDIAAHVEGKTPIGRIGATRHVLEESPFHFTESEASTDGYAVHLLDGALGPLT